MQCRPTVKNGVLRQARGARVPVILFAPNFARLQNFAASRIIDGTCPGLYEFKVRVHYNDGTSNVHVYQQTTRANAQGQEAAATGVLETAAMGSAAGVAAGAGAGADVAAVELADFSTLESAAADAAGELLSAGASLRAVPGSLSAGTSELSNCNFAAIDARYRLAASDAFSATCGELVD